MDLSSASFWSPLQIYWCHSVTVGMVGTNNEKYHVRLSILVIILMIKKLSKALRFLQGATANPTAQ